MTSCLLNINSHTKKYNHTLRQNLCLKKTIINAIKLLGKAWESFWEDRRGLKLYCCIISTNTVRTVIKFWRISYLLLRKTTSQKIWLLDISIHFSTIILLFKTKKCLVFWYTSTNNSTIPSKSIRLTWRNLSIFCQKLWKPSDRKLQKIKRKNLRISMKNFDY